MTLHISTFGTGATPVLAVHCGLGRSGMLKGVAALCPETTFTAPDLPGHGRSGPWPEGVDVHDAACDAIRPLVKDGVHLLGHSFGATVALRLALEQPGAVQRLTLIEPVLFAAAKGTAAGDAYAAMDERFAQVFYSGDMTAAAECFHSMWGGGLPWAKLPPEAQAMMAEGMPFIAGSEPCLWQDVHGLLAPGGLERLTCPVRFVRGADSQPVVAAIHAALMARLPDAEETVVAGAGHMVPLTHPQDVAAVVGG